MKTIPEPFREKRVYGRRLLIYRNIRSNEPVADNLWATIFPPAWDWDESNTSAELYDWKWEKEAGTIYVRGQLYRGNGQYQPINGTFIAVLESETLKAPGRNFVWSDGSLGRQWRNAKTGERRGAY